MAFVEHKAPGELPTTRESSLTPMKLSEAIRKGKPLIREESKSSYALCGLGCAWAGVHGRELTVAEANRLYTKHHGFNLQRAMGRAMGFDPNLAEAVHAKHLAGMPALEIADWLEGQGY